MGIRWDAVVKKDALRPAPRAPEATAAAVVGAPVDVQVWLFGRLAGPEVANPLTFRFERGCTLRDVLDELGRRFGPEFMRTLRSDSGEALNICRVFLDGDAVKDMATPVAAGLSAATVEIILFREIEGG
jgi:hypothetical protein